MSRGPYDADLAIVGLGIAGLTAGLYAARNGLEVVGFDPAGPGGRLWTIGPIENMVGFPQGIAGTELASICTEQALSAGLKTNLAEVTAIRATEDEGGSPAGWIVQLSSGSEFAARAVIVASGSRLARLGVDGEDKFEGRGVSTCATCDGEFYRGRAVAVIGGGDSALDEALYMTSIASAVHVVHRRKDFRGADSTRKKLMASPNVTMVLDATVTEIVGEETVTGVRISQRVAEGERQSSLLAVHGVFPYVGLVPNTSILKGLVPLELGGWVPVNNVMATHLAGLFVVGDLRAGSSRQLVSAAGDGATAAISVFEFLQRR